jgi:hypothetical protein
MGRPRDLGTGGRKRSEAIGGSAKGIASHCLTPGMELSTNPSTSPIEVSTLSFVAVAASRKTTGEITAGRNLKPIFAELSGIFFLSYTRLSGGLTFKLNELVKLSISLPVLRHAVYLEFPT